MKTLIEPYPYILYNATPRLALASNRLSKCRFKKFDSNTCLYAFASITFKKLKIQENCQ